jgi:hypothetical protein
LTWKCFWVYHENYRHRKIGTAADESTIGLDTVPDVRTGKLSQLMEAFYNAIKIKPSGEEYKMVSPEQHTGPLDPAKALVDYNHCIEETATVTTLNEDFLSLKIRELKKIGPLSSELYWLTAARLNELALLCAGTYADNYEVTAAGDLLFNPRKILVYTSDAPRGIIKERHSRLTDQFSQEGKTVQNVITWLKTEAIVDIKQLPILQYLYQRLSDSGCIARNYLESTMSRMTKIADALSFIAAWHLPDFFAFCQRLQQAAPDEKKFILSHLCNFDWQTFFELGREIEQWHQRHRCSKKFLIQCPPV